MTMRFVTMADLHAFQAVAERLQRVTAEAAKVAADGADIVVRAAQDGNADWALRFGEEANDNLTELYLSITAEWVAAAENFTGEKRLLFESFEGYCSRINSALDDLGSLTAMMRRNGVLFVGP